MKSIDAGLKRCARLALQGEHARAVALLEALERDWPLEARIQRQLAQLYATTGQQLHAAAATLAAEGLEARQPLTLYNLATGYFQHGQLLRAEKWYRVALMLEPDLAVANQNLAVILHDRGAHAEAQVHRHRAYQRQWLFVDACAQPVARVLLLCAAGVGNIPFRSVLDPLRFATWQCIVEYAHWSALPDPPAYQVIFNVIGDADCEALTMPGFLAFVAQAGVPVLNAPERVAHTRRDRLPARLADLAHVRVPNVVRIAGTRDSLEKQLAAAWSGQPVILRCALAHGGAGVALVKQAQQLAQWLDARPAAAAAIVYATDYHDTRGADGLFRKYRVFVIAGRLYPYHLAISAHWLVHYFSAQMLGDARKIDEERAFLADPVGVLGAAAWQALEQIGERLALDYAGIDFTIGHDGSLVVFEANATMLAHLESSSGPLAFKNPAVEAIVRAVEEMVVMRIDPPMPRAPA